MAAILDATMIWLASLVTLPAPTGPVSSTLDPIDLRIPSTFPKVLASPPHMMASVPSMALGSPPLTGASINSISLAAQAAPTFCETIGLERLLENTAAHFH